MEIERHTDVGNKPTEEMLDYCLTRLEDSDEFVEGITWDSEVVAHLTVEELIGALVAAEYDR